MIPVAVSSVGRLLAGGAWGGYCCCPIDVGSLVELLSPRPTVFFKFDSVLVYLDDLHAADNFSFMDELVADYGAGSCVADENAGYEPNRPCAGA